MMTTASIDLAVPSVTSAEGTVLATAPVVPSSSPELPALEPFVEKPFAQVLSENADLQSALESIVRNFEIPVPARREEDVVSTVVKSGVVSAETRPVVADLGDATSSTRRTETTPDAPEAVPVQVRADPVVTVTARHDADVVLTAPHSVVVAPVLLDETLVSTASRPDVVDLGDATISPCRTEAVPGAPEAVPVQVRAKPVVTVIARPDADVASVESRPDVVNLGDATISSRRTEVVPAAPEIDLKAPETAPVQVRVEPVVTVRARRDEDIASTVVLQAIEVPVLHNVDIASTATQPTAEAPVSTADAVRAVYASDPVMAPQAVVSSEVLIQAANAVADTLMVTPGLLRGQGEIIVQLKPDVLEGTEIKIAVTGRQIEVQFAPQTQDMSVLIEQCRPQLEQHLAERIHSFQIAVEVRPNLARVHRVPHTEEEA